MTVAPAPQRSEARTRRPQSGPPLLAPVLAFAALTVAYVAVNSSTPHPDASGTAVLHYAQTHATTIKVGALLLFSSAVPLALCAAILYRRLRALGVTAPGSAITLGGGVLAAGATTLSAMFTWTGGRLPADASPALARALADLSFISGGPGYVVMYALFAAGISVTGLMAGLLPRAVTWTGLGHRADLPILRLLLPAPRRPLRRHPVAGLRCRPAAPHPPPDQPHGHEPARHALTTDPATRPERDPSPAAERDGDAAELDALPTGGSPSASYSTASSSCAASRRPAVSAFDFEPDFEVREVTGTACMIGTQQQSGSHQDGPADGISHAARTLTGGPGWKLVGIHLRLRTPPMSLGRSTLTSRPTRHLPARHQPGEPPP
ncbi:hypothetical protein [Streptomyces sp. NPDC001312]|uniref:hypothetical protein n=1 Tax=Streptomyces sp. NPDC001312 TaxID=3364561 RepID=UPI0036C90421